MKSYKWAYKKPGKGQIKQHTVCAEDEKGALRAAPEELPGGWRRYGFLGEAA